MNIIDFHTHATGLDYDQPFRKYNIVNVIAIPFGYPREWKWADMTTIAGMNAKPDQYCDFLANKLVDVNRLRYENIQTANRHISKENPYYIFVPWISLLTNIDQLLNTSWFAKSNIVKFIPVFDDIPPVNQETWEENYLPKLHAIVSKLPQKCIMIHTGWGSSPVLYNNLIGNNPDKIFILAHMKEDDDSDNIERQSIMNKYENVYLELSYLSSPKRLAQYVNNYGFCDRILFGSDYRDERDECTLEWMISAVKLAPISNEARNRIFYENARELLQKLGISGN